MDIVIIIVGNVLIVGFVFSALYFIEKSKES